MGGIGVAKKENEDKKSERIVTLLCSNLINLSDDYVKKYRVAISS